MSEERFRVVYEGPGLSDGTMDVRALAPSLLALGDLVHESNRLLNGDNAKVAVEVRADFRAGSFGVDLQLVWDITDAARATLVALQPTGALELLTILGFVGLDFPGMFQLIRFLKGAEPQAVEQRRSGDIALTNIEGSTVVINKNTYLLLSDPAARQSAYEVVAPLERPGIERVQIGKPGEGVKVERDEVGYFASGVPESNDKVILDTTTEAVLSVIRPDLSGSLQWTVSDGMNQFLSKIEDAGFLDRVARREITFGAHDSLRVRMRVITRQRATGMLRTTRTVVEVHEVISGPADIQLSFPP